MGRPDYIRIEEKAKMSHTPMMSSCLIHFIVVTFQATMAQMCGSSLPDRKLRLDPARVDAREI